MSFLSRFWTWVTNAFFEAFALALGAVFICAHEYPTYQLSLLKWMHEQEFFKLYGILEGELGTAAPYHFESIGLLLLITFLIFCFLAAIKLGMLGLQQL